MCAVLEWHREQAMAALCRGNTIRSYRARLKAEVGSGDAAYDAFLVDGRYDPMLKTMRLEDALRAMPKIGRVKANRIMQLANVSPRVTLGGMTAAQRDRLYVVLESYPAIKQRLGEAR